ncbi:hypothetical protein RCL1_007506 [Eukaryota sp. TZLM3-RCL]
MDAADQDSVYRLNLAGEQRQLLLVRLPSDIVDAWTAEGESRVQVGTLRVTQKPNCPPEFSLISNVDVPSVPSEYNLNKEPIEGASYAFSINEKEQTVGIEGTVNSKYRAKPDLKNKSLLNQLGMHSRMVNEFRPRTQQFDTLAQIRPLGGYGTELEIKSSSERRELRRVRVDAEILKNMLFALFARKPQWSFADLVFETDQPTQHLKEVLESIAERHVSGVYKDLYELKPELRG